VASCGTSANGSGFELSPTLVATAAHVVEGGQVIRVIQGTTSTAGVIVGIDPSADVALVRTATPLTGHEFTFADESPRVGDQIAAIGFPLGEPIAFHPGTVNGLGRKVQIDGVQRHDLLEIDAATTHGGSGGPVVRADGSVVGIVHAAIDGEAGKRWAVSSATASPLIAGWTDQPEETTPADCADAVDVNGDPIPAGSEPTRDDLQAVTTLHVYFESVNNGDFSTALAQLVRPGSLDDFADGVASSHDTDIRYRSVQKTGDRLVVWVTFTSHQDPGDGPAERPEETCTNWTLDYVLAPHNGLWLIESSRPHEGTGNFPCAG
jgi:hypothetical protein